MGIEKVTEVIETLQKAGIRIQRGFPPEKMPYLTGTVAAAALEQVDKGLVTVAVRIYTPMRMGSEQCEDTAMLVAQAMAGMGAAYSMTGCKFDSKMGLFTMTVLATH